MVNRRNNAKMTVLIGMVIFIISCSPKRMILKQFDGVFDSIETVYLTDDDPQLVRESFPFNLKIIEILLDKNPDDRDMLLTAMSSFTMYSFGFIMEDAEKAGLEDYRKGTEVYYRANKLFNRAFKYGLHGLELKYPDIHNWMDSRNESNPFELEDLPYLYWLSATIGGQVSSSQGNPKYVVDLPKVGWLLDKSLELDEDWNDGALYRAMISYTMSRPDALKNREQLAREYFKKAIDATENKDCSIYITLAESVCIKNQYKDEFNKIIDYVIDFDIDAVTELKLTNAMAQSRAKWLLSRMDELFY
jgi:hypothetical protein